MKTIYVITATVSDYFSEMKPYTCEVAFIDRDVAAQIVKSLQNINMNDIDKFKTEYLYWIEHRDAVPYPAKVEPIIYDIMELQLNERISK